MIIYFLAFPVLPLALHMIPIRPLFCRVVLLFIPRLFVPVWLLLPALITRVITVTTLNDTIGKKYVGYKLAT